jgi:hypothetical protein
MLSTRIRKVFASNPDWDTSYLIAVLSVSANPSGRQIPG